MTGKARKELLARIRAEDEAQTSMFPVETEAQIAVRKLDEMEARQKEYLEGLRQEARHLCYSNAGFPHYRVSNCVTSDDVCEAKGIKKMPRYFTNTRGNNNVNGQIFRDGRWAFVGFVKSRREGRRCSVIRAWTLKENADRVKAEWYAVYGNAIASQVRQEKAESMEATA